MKIGSAILIGVTLSATTAMTAMTAMTASARDMSTVEGLWQVSESEDPGLYLGERFYFVDISPAKIGVRNAEPVAAVLRRESDGSISSAASSTMAGGLAIFFMGTTGSGVDQKDAFLHLLMSSAQGMPVIGSEILGRFQINHQSQVRMVPIKLKLVGLATDRFETMFIDTIAEQAGAPAKPPKAERTGVAVYDREKRRFALVNRLSVECAMSTRFNPPAASINTLTSGWVDEPASLEGCGLDPDRWINNGSRAQIVSLRPLVVEEDAYVENPRTDQSATIHLSHRLHRAR